MKKNWNDLPESEFRENVRQFILEYCPPNLRFPKRRLRWKEVKDWYFTLASAGLLAPTWPITFGGMGLSPSKTLAYLETMEVNGAPRLPDQGIINLGPLLIKHGNDEQRRRYLPRILSGEHIWCQGYSEPNAGSDLASLKTSAVLDGDDYVVNGQKIWTTWAHDATHMFALVRTDTSVTKQAGLSFLLIHLNQPGINVRPIETITGHPEFCEVFFDNARSHRSNLVGEVNGGWKIAKALLGFERIWAGSPRQAVSILAQLEHFARRSEKLEDASWRDRLVQLRLDVADLEALYGNFAETVRRGETLGPDVSILKLWATETCQRMCELMVDICCEIAPIQADVSRSSGVLPNDSSPIDAMTPFLDSRSFTIYGGSSEIQRNIVSKQVLGLPS